MTRFIQHDDAILGIHTCQSPDCDKLAVADDLDDVDLDGNDVPRASWWCVEHVIERSLKQARADVLELRDLVDELDERRDGEVHHGTEHYERYR